VHRLIDARYQKIQAQPDEIEELLIQRGVKAIPRRSAEIVLDFDATDDPLHGSQVSGGNDMGRMIRCCFVDRDTF
jgi:hypothetical protein